MITSGLRPNTVSRLTFGYAGPASPTAFIPPAMRINSSIYVPPPTAIIRCSVPGVRPTRKSTRRLGNLPVRNVLVSADGEVQLLGFDLNPDLKLEFIPVDDSAPKVPDQKFDARTDCWVLGKLLQQMVEAGGEETRKAYREEAKLRTLVQTMTADDPEKRVANMSTLKSRLELMSRKEKKVDEASLLTAPITVLTVEEEDKFKEIKQRIKILIGVVILVFLLVALLGQTLFPEAGGF